MPVALELLDAPEHFRVQQVGHYPPANSSLGSRSETFLLLQPWPRAQPLLRASYPPFATQQVRTGPGDHQANETHEFCCLGVLGLFSFFYLSINQTYSCLTNEIRQDLVHQGGMAIDSFTHSSLGKTEALNLLPC